MDRDDNDMDGESVAISGRLMVIVATISKDLCCEVGSRDVDTHWTGKAQFVCRSIQIVSDRRNGARRSDVVVVRGKGTE